MTNPTPLSPAAQAVLNAFLGDAEHTGLQMDDMRENVAAALRAAADQVVPDEGDRWTRDMRGDAWTRWEERKLTRADLFAIAAELEKTL